MNDFPSDIYTEPSNIDIDTPNNLGPLRAVAGIWHPATFASNQTGLRRDMGKALR